MIPNSSNGYTYLGMHYKYVCNAKVSHPANHSTCINIRIKLIAENLSEGTISLSATDVERDIVRNGDKFPSELKAINEKLTWLADNNYIPSYYSDSKTVIFKKQALFSSISNRLVRTFEPIDLLSLVHVVDEIYIKVINYFVKKDNNWGDSVIMMEPKDTIDTITTFQKSISNQKNDTPLLIDFISTQQAPTISTPTQNVIKFPLDALKQIMFFTKDTNLDGIVEKVVNNLENPPEPGLLSKLTLFFSGYDKESLEGRAISANASFSNIFSILGNGSASVKRELYDFMFTNKSTKPEGGLLKTRQAFLEIKSYLDQFYILPEKVELDKHRLAFSILKDNELFDFLKSDELVTPLANLLKSLGVKNFDHDQVAFLTSILNHSQKLFSSFCARNPGHTEDPKLLLEKIYNDNLRESFEIAGKCYDLSKQLLPIIEIFISVNAYPVEHILNSTIPSAGYHINAKNLKNFKKCREVFEKYSDDALGVFTPLFVTTPLQTQIRNRKIENFVFNDPSQKVFKNDQITSKYIFADIKGIAFEEFSFNNSQFHNFNFENNYFARCDFSEVIFFGNITFKNVYMDQYSANQLLEAIRRSSKYPQCNLKTFGLQEILILSTSDTNKKIQIDITSNSEEDSLEELSFSGDEVAEFKEEKKPENIHADTTKEKKIYEDAEKSWDDLSSNLDDALRKSKENLKNARSGSNNNKIDAVRIKELEEKIFIQQKSIEAIQKGLRTIKSQRLLKEKISAEQLHLLNHKNKQVKLYYQTLLSNVCGFFQLIGLANNPQSIIKLQRGKCTELANNVEKLKSLAEGKADNLATLWNVICSTGDHFIEYAEMSKPIFNKIPGGSILATGIEKILESSETKKIKRTNQLFRGMTSKKLEKIGDEIARKITFSYEEQILLLSEDSAITFAECASQCIAGALMNGQLTEQENLVTQAWLSVRILKTTHNATIPLLGIALPWTNKSLLGSDNKSFYTAQDLYLNTGVAIVDGNKKELCPLNKNQSSKFGYFRLKIEDHHAYFSRSSDENKLPVVSPISVQNTHHIDSNPHIKADRISQLEQEFILLKNQHNDTQRKMDLLARELFNLKKATADELSGKPTITTPSPKTTSRSVSEPSKVKRATSIFIDSPIGLPNIGNSCYMNAALQVILNIPSICAAIKEPKLKMDEKDPYFIGKATTFKNSLKYFLDNRQSLEADSLDKLRRAFFESRSKDMPWVEGVLLDQHQSEEFLEQVLNVINWKPMSIDTRTINNYGEVIRTQKTPSNMIALSLSGNHSRSLETALKDHCSKDSIDHASKLPCIEQEVIINEPEYIFIQFKRLVITDGQEVINNAEIIISSNQVVQIPCANGEKTLPYQVISYIKRNANPEMKSGHYIAYIKNENSDWYSCDDATVTKCKTLPHDLATKSTCILLKKLEPQTNDIQK